MNEKETICGVNFQRNGNAVRHRFFLFLLPSLLTSAATSLNNLLDSIVVSQTLGSGAMSFINLASPIVFIMSAIYVLLGGGGSTVYAFLKGKLEKDKAESVLSVTIFLAGLLSLIIAVTGVLFSVRIAGFLSGGMAVTNEFTDYIRITFFSSLFIIPLQTLLMFYPANGLPMIATIVNIIVNVVNICCDYLLTALIPLGLKGSAYATLAGYITGAVITGGLFLREKYRLSFLKSFVKDFSYVKEIIAKGAAVCISQVGFSIKVSFSNLVAISFAGAAGMTVFSICFQTVSMISIVIGGILHSMTPIVAALYGMKDYHGIRYLMKTILRIEIAFSVMFFVFLELFPGSVLSFYNVNSAESLTLGIHGLRIFSIMYLFRGTVLVFMYYYQTIGAKVYSVILSILDGFAGIIPLALILCSIFGIDGLWLSYAVCALLMLLGVLLAGLFIKKITHGKCRGIYMLPDSEYNSFFTDYSFSKKRGNISSFVLEVENYCIEKGIDTKKANLAALSCEELCLYFDRTDSDLDIMLYLMDGSVVIDFRSPGEARDFLAAAKEEYGNINVLVKIAKEVKYDYVIGMNLVQVRL